MADDILINLLAWCKREREKLQMQREMRPKATCAAPLCEVLSPCRGPRPHHVQTDRVGSWEISWLTVSVACEGRSASGRRGVVADDARAREVELCHSSCEADEQSGAYRCGAVRDGADRCGAGGAKGRGRGERQTSTTRTGHSTGYACSRRWPAYGAHYSPWIPEVGTVCGKAARTGLCGGCEATRIPTAPLSVPFACILLHLLRSPWYYPDPSRSSGASAIGES